jgi:hypothetical protein
MGSTLVSDIEPRWPDIGVTPVSSVNEKSREGILHGLSVSDFMVRIIW